MREVFWVLLTADYCTTMAFINDHHVGSLVGTIGLWAGQFLVRLGVKERILTPKVLESRIFCVTEFDLQIFH